MQTYFEQWVKNLIESIPNILTALVIFLACVYLASLLAKGLKKLLEKRRAQPEVANLLSQLTYWSIVAIGIITALQRFFDVTAFLAGLGIIGFTVGFALQDVMKNFAAGIILLIQRPFNVGEAVGIANFDGSILAIDLRTTEMKTFDGRIVILPNADILSNPIINYSRAHRRRVDLTLDLSNAADPEVIRKLVLDLVAGAPGYVNDPAPLAVFQTLAAPSFALAVFFWVDVSKVNPAVAKDAALLRIKSEFEQRGIALPLPAQIIYMDSQNV